MGLPAAPLEAALAAAVAVVERDDALVGAVEAPGDALSGEVCLVFDVVLSLLLLLVLLEFVCC